MNTQGTNNKTCPKCGTLAEGKFCPECGEKLILEPVKQEVKKVSKWKDRLFLGICIIVIIFAWIMIQPSSHNTSNQHTEVYEGWSKNTFQSAARNTDYESLARYPEQYKGSPLTENGEVSQVQESSGKYILRVSTKKMDSGKSYIGDDIWVTYDISKGTRPIENDLVTIYGVSRGLQEYTTVLGSSKSIPSIEAYYIDITGRA